MLRVVKSPAELVYVRQCGRACRRGRSTRPTALASAPGAFEGDILAAMHGAVFRGGGDDPANEYHHRLRLRTRSCACNQAGRLYSRSRRPAHPRVRRRLSPLPRLPHAHDRHRPDRSAHACDARSRGRCAASPPRPALRPGRPIGEVFDAHAAVLDRPATAPIASMPAATASAPPSRRTGWIGRCSITGNPVEAAPGMIFFIHIIVFDAENGIAITHGRTLRGDGARRPAALRRLARFRRQLGRIALPHLIIVRLLSIGAGVGCASL